MKYLQLASVSTPAAVSTWFQDELVNRGVDAAYTYYVLSLLKEPDDEDGYFYSATTKTSQAIRPERRRLLAKRCAIECLKSAADSNEGFDALVEELLTRLKPTEDADQADNAERQTTTTNQRSESRDQALINERRLEEPKTLAERAKKYFDAFPALQADERSPPSLCSVSLKSTVASSSVAEETSKQQQTLQKTALKERKKKNKNKRKSPQQTNQQSEEIAAQETSKSAEQRKGKDRQQQQQQHCEVSAEVRTNIYDEENIHHNLVALNEAGMGSIVREETLLSRLTQKFDSKLAAIWADVPTVEDQSSLWKVSLDFSVGVKSMGKTGSDRNYDEVIFSIPNLSIFNKILEDDDELATNVSQNLHSHSELGTFSLPPQSAVVRTLCLKNSTLKYDKNNTAFTEVSSPLIVTLTFIITSTIQAHFEYLFFLYSSHH